MSIVERAIQKMQARTSDAKAPARTPPAPGAPAERVNVVTPAPLPAVARPAPRVVNRSGKKISFNRDALRADGILPPEHQERLIANQYRQIKRPLIDNAIGRNNAAVPDGHLIMVASAVPGEGKTFTSVNLAMSLAAERDLSVLLVDADVAKPHISSIFGLGREPGLLDCLLNEALDVESLIVETDVDRLSILPAGPVTENATELLASSRMATIVRALGSADPNRIVVFDSPPLLLTSESRVLSSIVGQIVLVVTAGETPQQTVMGAISHIAEGKSIGIVLNQSVGESSAQYHYPGYGSYGESAGTADSREPQQKLKE